MSVGGVQSTRGAASPVPSLSAAAQADADSQQVVLLVNRFVISSVQFLNRFVEECESKLVRTDEALQQLELQTQLLEHMLLSSGVANTGEEKEAKTEGREDDDADSSARWSDKDGRDDDTYSGAADSYNDEHDNCGSGRHSRRRHRSQDSVNSSGHRGRDSGETSLASRRLPLAAPGAYRKGPPRPPPGVARAAAAAEELAVARAATLAIVGAPVLLPPLTANGEAPAPPPPLELRPGRLSMRAHPKLKGYFELLALRVPAAFVKAKMQADGYQGDWLDTPNAPAPATLSTVVRSFADEPD